MSTPSVTNTSNTSNTVTNVTNVTNVSDSNSSDVNVDCGGKICTRCSYGSCTTFPNMYVTGIETNNSNNGTIIGIIIFIVVIFILVGVCFYFRKRMTNFFKRQ